MKILLHLNLENVSGEGIYVKFPNFKNVFACELNLKKPEWD